MKKTRPLPPSLRLNSPAKINLFLNVLFKRKDGFHEIHTLFERIRLFDELTLIPSRSGIKIITRSKNLPRGSGNICYRAAKLLKDRFKIKRGVLIKIEKRIPIAAGLGGGSSNGASVLLGLNRLWKLGLSKKELLRAGAELGSDVPFFILETPFALGRGRGEILRKIRQPGKKIWHCLVKPPFSISTKAAYQRLKTSSLTPKKADVRMLLHSIHKGDSESLSKLLTNSLEDTLNKRVMAILKIKKELMRHGALGSLVSGSGPTVFGIFSSQDSARKAARGLRKNRRWQVFVASTF